MSLVKCIVLLLIIDFHLCKLQLIYTRKIVDDAQSTFQESFFYHTVWFLPYKGALFIILLKVTEIKKFKQNLLLFVIK